MTNNYNKRAVTYSLLAHVRNSRSLSNGPLDIFVPIVKKGLHFMNESGQYKGESISEIKEVISQEYAIDIPLPVLRNILILIANNINGDEELFILYDDGGFWIKNYVFSEYDEKLNESEKNVKNLEKLFKSFCEINNIKDQNEDGLIKFIERNKQNLSQYISDKVEISNDNFNIEAKFIQYFKNISSTVYDEIRKLYIGAILTSYLEYSPVDMKIDVDLLFDTNFIISLLDLNTPESTHTCRKLIEIGVDLGFKFHVLIDTIEEAQRLLNYKADNFDNSVIQKYVNKEDIYNACTRLNYNKADLERISDNLQSKIELFGIIIIPNTAKLKNIAKFSDEYTQLKQIRNSDKSALHDATCLTYVKIKRNNKAIRSFEKVNCWFVNNSISYNNEYGFEGGYLNGKKGISETIRVDNLINILWLSNPFLNLNENLELADIGLTSLIASTLNDSLPKSRVIKELDDNIQKYRNSSITDRDVYMLSVRIANGQLKEIEKFNELAETNIEKFNEKVKDEAHKQEELEKERAIKLDKTLEKFSRAIEDFKEHKNKIEEKTQMEIHNRDSKHEKELKEKENQIKILERKLENEKRETTRNLFIKNKVKSWRCKTLILLIILFTILVVCLLLYIFDVKIAGFSIRNLSKDPFVSILLGIFIPFILNIFVGKILYDKYYNISNIEAYKNSIKIPDHLKEI